MGHVRAHWLKAIWFGLEQTTLLPHYLLIDLSETCYWNAGEDACVQTLTLVGYLEETARKWMESTSEGDITPFNTHTPLQWGLFLQHSPPRTTSPMLNREHQGSDKESNKYSKKQSLKVGCPNIKGELGKLIFLCFRAPQASLWILRAFQLQMNRGISAKVQRRRYLTKIFLDRSICGDTFKLQLWLLQWQVRSELQTPPSKVAIQLQRNHNIMQEAQREHAEPKKKKKGDEAGIP